MTPLAIRDLSYANPENTRISMRVMTEAFGEIPFLYDPEDPAPTTRAIGRLLGEKFFNIEPYVPPTTEDQRAQLMPLSPRQLRSTLISHDIFPSAVEALIATIEGPKERALAETDWEYATSFDRSHPLIAFCAIALGLTDEEVDAMWREGLNL